MRTILCVYLAGLFSGLALSKAVWIVAAGSSFARWAGPWADVLCVAIAVAAAVRYRPRPTTNQVSEEWLRRARVSEPGPDA